MVTQIMDRAKQGEEWRAGNNRQVYHGKRTVAGSVIISMPLTLQETLNNSVFESKSETELSMWESKVGFCLIPRKKTQTRLEVGSIEQSGLEVSRPQQCTFNITKVS